MLDFQQNLDYFAQRGIGLLAVSADTEEKARETVRLYRITFPVCYGVDPEEASRLTGAFYNQKDGYLHAAGFILDREGRIYNAVYSTRSIGRFAAKDCIGLIDYA